MKSLACAVSVFLTFSNTVFSAEQPDMMQSEIKHVVVLMLENRSQDNVLAWLYDHEDLPFHFIPATETTPYHGLTEDTLDQYTNTLRNAAGEIVYTCHPVKGIPSRAKSKLLNSPKIDPHEDFYNVTPQIFGYEGSTVPDMSGFLQNYASVWWDWEWVDQKSDICAVMETYTSKELPVLYGLAKKYAVSDLWFSSVPTQTNPNRAFSICGTSEGQVMNGAMGNSKFKSDTIWNRLYEQAPESTWTIFWQSDLIPGIVTGPFTGPNTFLAMSNIPEIDSHLMKVDFFHKLAREGNLPDYSFIEPQWTNSINLNAKIKYFGLNTLKRSVEAFVLGMQGNDLHPPGDVRTGENMVANIYTSLTANPEAWNKTLLVILFDEHGGIWDHIPPPAAIPPDDNFQNGFHFDRMGVRIPAIFISPLVNEKTVIRSDNPEVPFDHTSLIATILKWKNIDKSQWNMGKRVDAAPTFNSVITRETPRTDWQFYPDGYALDHLPDDVIHMGDKFCLRNEKGEFLINATSGSIHYARLGNSADKITLAFGNGAGEITHGSFVLIRGNDPILGEDNYLKTIMSIGDCFYAEEKHAIGEWWTVKNMDRPYVGAPIHYGDRIYIENHIYLDIFQCVPGRLCEKDGFFGEFLSTIPITSDGSENNYWVIERP